MNTKPQKPQLKSNSYFGKMSGYVLWVSILIGGIGIGIAVNSYYNQEPTNNPVPGAFSYETLTISKQFVCSCGSCGEKELISCTCPTAIETKQFIEESLINGMSAGDVTDIVKITYGHYKG